MSEQELRRKLLDEDFVEDDLDAQVEALEKAIDVLDSFEEDAEADVVRDLLESRGRGDGTAGLGRAGREGPSPPACSLKRREDDVSG